MKRLFLPALILAAVVIVWLVQSSYEKKRISETTIENFLDLNATDINRMVFHLPTDTLQFMKQGGFWFLQGPAIPQKADDMVINNVISMAVSISVGKIYSENPDQQGLFNVDSASGVLAEFFKDDELLGAVIVGKLTSDYAHTYIRRPGSDKVYASDKVLTYTFNRDRNQWLDKTLMAMNPDMIRTIEIVYPDKSYKLDLHKNEWYIAKSPYKDSVIADTTKVRSYLSRISFLRGGDFADISDEGLINFENPSLILYVTLADSSRQMVEFGEVLDKEATRYYCRRPERQDTLVVSMPIYNAVAEEFSDFLPD